MQKPLFYLILFILAYFIYYTEGVAINQFTIWNMLPLFVSALIYRFGSKHGAYSFLLGSMMLSGYLHLTWFFDWGDIKEGSTSALIFVVIPIFSLFAGGISFAFAKRFNIHSASKNDSKH